MNTKKLWVYLTVLVVVAGVFVLSEFVFLKKKQEKETAPLFNLIPGSIGEISWQRGDAVVELKKNKHWEIIRPITAEADSLVLEGVTQGLSNLKPERRFPPAEKDLTEFGLNPPQSIIAFSAQGKRHEVRIGSQAAVGNSRYLMVSGSPDIFLVEAFSIRELDRDLTALREKRLFSLPLEQVERVSIERGSDKWLLKKTAQGWIEQGSPGQTLAKSKVESFIIELNWAKAQSFLEGEKESPVWGLQEPRGRIDLTGKVDDQKREETLLIGAEAPGKGVYARSSRYAPAITIDGALIGRIPRTLAEWQETEKSKTGGSPAEKK